MPKTTEISSLSTTVNYRSASLRKHCFSTYLGILKSFAEYLWIVPYIYKFSLSATDCLSLLRRCFDAQWWISRLQILSLQTDYRPAQLIPKEHFHPDYRVWNSRSSWTVILSLKNYKTWGSFEIKIWLCHSWPLFIKRVRFYCWEILPGIGRPLRIYDLEIIQSQLELAR